MAIQILSPQLANQIAAGEVVERPASIIKELVENSIDAGATKIDIDLEQGGSRLIRVKDNGSGIAKEELSLALARHATSKIHSIDDLNEILSLGFRGEALASISSVSRLTLSSRPEYQTEGWRVYAEGRDMQPVLNPVAHPVGTTVEVLDLFYNTPARKRFLKSDKTELAHSVDVIKRIALAYPNVSFNLTHQGKQLHHYKSHSDQKRWLASICGNKFAEQADYIEYEHEDLAVKGWLVQLNEPVSYFYVNGRMVKDKVIQHAIRQAEQEMAFERRSDQILGYLLYLTLDPEKVDVNVHPAKHEVRFHDARLVHDFVHYAVSSFLVQSYRKQNEQIDYQNDASPQSSLENNPLPNSQLNDSHNRKAAGENIYYQTSQQPSHSEANNELEVKTHTSAQFVREEGDKTELSERHNAYTLPTKPSKKEIRQHNEGYRTLLMGSPERMQLKEKESESIQERVISSLFPVRENPDRLTAQTSKSETIPTHSTHPLEETVLHYKKDRIFGRVVALIDSDYALLEKQTELTVGTYQTIFSLLSVKMLEQMIFHHNLLQKRYSFEPLILPLTLKVDKQEMAVIECHQNILQDIGLEIERLPKKVVVKSVIQPLRQTNLELLLRELMQFLQNKSTDFKSHVSQNAYNPIIKLLFEHSKQSVKKESDQVNRAYVIQKINELEQLNDTSVLSEQNLTRLIQPVDLTVLKTQFNPD